MTIPCSNSNARSRLIAARAAINRLRALLFEQGIVIPVGRQLLARQLPEILEKADNGLPV